jgi:hypothetical protein
MVRELAPKGLSVRQPSPLRCSWTARRLQPIRFITHSHRATAIAVRHGWLPGARYTNLRDIKRFDEIGFLDIDWEQYDFCRHLSAVKAVQPWTTVAQDIQDRRSLERIVDQAWELAQHVRYVVVVPKISLSANDLEQLIPEEFLLGYSVPTRYGQTRLRPGYFKRPVHLLGGRPDVQRRLAESMDVFSFDCNRFTLDAQFGDYFDGETFRPHPIGGYDRCIVDSVKNINRMWNSYKKGHAHGTERRR